MNEEDQKKKEPSSNKEEPLNEEEEEPKEEDLNHSEPLTQVDHFDCTNEDCKKRTRLEQIYDLEGTIIEQYPPATRTEQDRKTYREGAEIPWQPVSILVNHFQVIPQGDQPARIDQYEVKLNRSCDSKDLTRSHNDAKLNRCCVSKDLTRSLKYLIQEVYFNGELIGYDDGKNMFIAESTLQKKKEYLDREDIQFDITPWKGQNTTYEMNLRRVKEVLRGFLPNCPQHYLAALKAALRGGSPRSLPFAVNNTSYYKSDDQNPPFKLNSRGELVEDGRVEATQHFIVPMKGFVKSLRAVEQGLTLNLDSTSMVFHPRKCVNHYLQWKGIEPAELLDGQGVSKTKAKDSMKKAKRMLEGLYVDIMYLETYRKYIITDISVKSAREHMVSDNEKNINVVNYFKENYKIDVEPRLPCLIVRGKGKNAEPDVARFIERDRGKNSDDTSNSYFLPMDACVIASGQKFGGCRDSTVRKELMKLAGGDPEKRYQMIRQNFMSLSKLFRGQKSDDRNFPSLKPFGIDIGGDMISVVGRVIPPPRLATQIWLENESEPNAAKTQLSKGKWSLKNVFKPALSLDAEEWNAFLFSNTDTSLNGKKMIEDILKSCSDMLITCFEKPKEPIWIRTQDSQTSNNLAIHFKEKIKRVTLGRVRFVFCIFHKNLRKPLYDTVRSICEKEKGWITQCCLMERLNFKDEINSNKLPGKDEINSNKPPGKYEINSNKLPGKVPRDIIYYKKVALKVNAKLGGINNALKENTFLGSLFGSKNSVILFGVNVTCLVNKRNNNDSSKAVRQNSSDVKSKGHILLTMVASMEWPTPGQYYTRVFLLRPDAKKAEIAYRLSIMTEELLGVYIEKNQGEIPTRAIFFRDGVSEGEFQGLVDKEFLNLKHKLQSIYFGIKVSLIVAQRNQNTRFFIKSIGEGGKEVIQNAKAGTVVDSDITRPTVPPQLADFYLLSQGIQQKSLERPTHYFLLYDENGLSTNPERLEKFVFYLCYTHATSTTSVAVVPPLLYAHEAAARAGASYAASRAEANPVADIQEHIRIHDNLVNTMYFC